VGGRLELIRDSQVRACPAASEAVPLRGWQCRARLHVLRGS